MASSQQSWYATGLRFCGSCIVSLLYWAVWLILGATLAVLIYILVEREMPVPDFVLRRVEARLDEANFAIKFGRARLDPTGKILLEDVQLRSKQYAEPLLTSNLVYVRRSVWSILAGRPIPDEIRLEGATLRLPAMLSPSGASEPVVNDLAVVLRHDENIWHIDQVTGRIGRLKVTVEGDIGTPSHSSGDGRSPQEITMQFLQAGRRLILQINEWEAFDDPVLTIHLDNKEGIGNTAAGTFTASAARRPWRQPLVLGPMTASTSVLLDGKSERVIRVHASVSRISHEKFTAENIRTVMTARVAQGKTPITPVEAMMAVGSLAIDDEQISSPLFIADLERWPEIKVSTALQLGDEYLTAKVDADLKQQTARIFAEGTGQPEIINRSLAKHTPRAAPYFIFGDPINFTAEAVLAAGWRFESLSSRVIAGRINSRDVKITSARGRVDIVGMNFLAHDAQVEMGDSLARGSYWMNFSTTDYRMLLKGQLQPAKISGWFNGAWWMDFWHAHFGFNSLLPKADVDVQGRWKDASRTEYFGEAQANQAMVWGGKFDQVNATVFLRPLFTHIIEFNGKRAGGAQMLEGELKRFASNSTKETNRLEFELKGNVDPETYHGMLEGKADEVLATLKFSKLPYVRVTGSIEGNGSVLTPNYTFVGQAEGGLHYYGFPLESVRVTGAVKGSNVQLDDIQVAAAGGRGAGRATLSGAPESPKLGFDVYLNGADLAKTIYAVQEYQFNQTGEKPDTAIQSDLMKRAAGGRLDVALSAQGTPGDFDSFSGTGNAALTGANLGEIHLFGLLSQVLSGLSLNFSSLKLNSAHTSFRMESGHLRFLDLKITGPSAVIDAKGDFAFANNGLDFAAKFKPFEESRSLFTTAIGIVINPITSILELKLGGQLNKPTWSIDLGSSIPRYDFPNPKEKKTEPQPAEAK